MFANFCKIVLFEVVWAHFQKICPNDPKKGDFEKCSDDRKTLFTSSPKCGNTPHMVRIMFGTSWKNALFGVIWAHFKKIGVQKNFFFRKSNFVPITASFFDFVPLIAPTFSWAWFFQKTKMCIFGPKTRVDQSTPMTLKLGLQHVYKVGTMSNSS